jgi:carboxylate-amine ligase
MLYRLKRNNQRWRRYSNMLIQENRWRAQRYGTNEGLIDYGIGEIVPYADLLEEMIELVRVDALALDCLPEVEHARKIVTGGTSAHRQLAAYDAAIASGAEPKEALEKVVDLLIEGTVAGL